MDTENLVERGWQELSRPGFLGMKGSKPWGVERGPEMPALAS